MSSKLCLARRDRLLEHGEGEALEGETRRRVQDDEALHKLDGKELVKAKATD